MSCFDLLEQMMTFVIESSFREQLCSRVKVRYGFYMQSTAVSFILAYVWPLLTCSARWFLCFCEISLRLCTSCYCWFRAVWYKVLGTRRIEAIQHFVRRSAKSGKLGFCQMADSKSMLEKKPCSACIQKTQKSALGYATCNMHSHLDT